MPTPISSRTKRERRTNAVIAMLTVLAIPAALAICGWLVLGVAFGGDEPDCDEYAFDAEAWAARDSDDRDDQAASLSRCDVLIGMTRSEVVELLGEPNNQRGRWAYATGLVNDALGPGDGQTLFVSFNPSGRVRTTDLAYHPDSYD
jgi:hypothetical protein